jgi:hypothetical protein
MLSATEMCILWKNKISTAMGQAFATVNLPHGYPKYGQDYWTPSRCAKITYTYTYILILYLE